MTRTPASPGNRGPADRSDRADAAVPRPDAAADAETDDRPGAQDGEGTETDAEGGTESESGSGSGAEPEADGSAEPPEAAADERVSSADETADDEAAAEEDAVTDDEGPADETVPKVELGLYQISVTVQGKSTDDLDVVESTAEGLLDTLVDRAGELEESPDDRGLG